MSHILGKSIPTAQYEQIVKTFGSKHAITVSNLAWVAQFGAELVERTTEKLTTISHDAEDLKEVVSPMVAALNMLGTIISTLNRYPHLLESQSIETADLHHLIASVSHRMGNALRQVELKIRLTDEPFIWRHGEFMWWMRVQSLGLKPTLRGRLEDAAAEAQELLNELNRLVLLRIFRDIPYLASLEQSLSMSNDAPLKALGTQSAPPKASHSQVMNSTRKALRCSIGGSTCFARPDSGSDRDIITETFAADNGILVQRGEADKSIFKLGSGKLIQSLGRALVPLRIFGDSQLIEHRWFDVIAKCPVPLILGLDFIRKFKLFTQNKHLLVDCPCNFGNLPLLKWIGSPRERINFVADGRSLIAGADTGSDLDLMSLQCARRRGFKIDRSESARNRVMLADETIVETIGQVHVSSVQLSHFDRFEMSFHVLPGLPCDVIFGVEFLEQMDAFNTCDIVHLDENDIHSLNTLINLGPFQAFLTRKRASKPDNTAQQEHDQAIEAEIYLRNKANRALAKMKDEARAATASEAEEVKRRAFDAGHMRCRHCIGAMGREDPFGERIQG
jgi:hypothetical protein